MGAVITSSIVFWYVATGVVLALGIVFLLWVRHDARVRPPTREEVRFSATEGFDDVAPVFVLGAVTMGLFLLLRRPLLVIELQLLGMVFLDWRRARRRERQWVPRRERPEEYWAKWRRHVALNYLPLAILNALLFWLLPVLL